LAASSSTCIRVENAIFLISLLKEIRHGSVLRRMAANSRSHVTLCKILAESVVPALEKQNW
jgi:hypothetical protein